MCVGSTLPFFPLLPRAGDVEADFLSLTFAVYQGLIPWVSVFSFFRGYHMP